MWDLLVTLFAGRRTLGALPKYVQTRSLVDYHVTDLVGGFVSQKLRKSLEQQEELLKLRMEEMEKVSKRIEDLRELRLRKLQGVHSHDSASTRPTVNCGYLQGSTLI
jgi:hypothetical protein